MFDSSNYDIINGYGKGLGVQNAAIPFGGTGYIFNPAHRAQASRVTRCMAKYNAAALEIGGGAGTVAILPIVTKLSAGLTTGWVGAWTGSTTLTSTASKIMSNAGAARKSPMTTPARLGATFIRAFTGNNWGTRQLTRIANGVKPQAGLRGKLRAPVAGALAAEPILFAYCQIACEKDPCAY